MIRASGISALLAIALANLRDDVKAMLGAGATPVAALRVISGATQRFNACGVAAPRGTDPAAPFHHLTSAQRGSGYSRRRLGGC
jgi:hypothetical protein